MQVIGYKNEHYLIAIGGGDAVVLDMTQDPPLLSPPQEESAYSGFAPFLDDPERILGAMSRAEHLDRQATHTITEEQLGMVEGGFKHGDAWITSRDGQDLTPKPRPML